MLRPAAEAPARAADGEQAEVVVVRRALGLQERGPGQCDLDPEAQGLGVEGHARVDVADVEHGVVEALDGHGILRWSSFAIQYATKNMKLQLH